MTTQIYVNLPVKNLQNSIDFFTHMGFTFNPRFTDANATCMIVGKNIFVMLLVENFFRTFIKKKLCDATKSTEVLLALAVESREKVDEMMKRALKAGGTEPREPQDHGWMYGRSFEDLNGHIWEVFWMDPTGMGKQA